MTTLNRIASLAALALAAAACGTDATAVTPGKPTIGTQIDRMGRPAVNTALSNPFELLAGTSDAAKDAYNASSDPTAWVKANASGGFKTEISTNLGIFDGLDLKCGNQLGAGATAVAGRYDTLASVLADDQLYLRSDKTSCGIYLAVEADATGLAPNNGDCGGRTPVEDVIDSTYQVLVTGTICALSSAVCGINDGVAVDGEGAANATTFPFLGAAN